ncbi:metallophosphoesterase [Lacticaseibacillus jixiensis]|uniref:metallophosphoesterase n=1 Tax=Lacticaseibacillus jixiensis TaxID=3231926 RepID=UPI0036F195B8
MLHTTKAAFKLIQFTDTHIGSYPFVADDLRTLEQVAATIAAEQPDLITITGDLIWSDGVVEPQRGLHALIEVLNRFDVPVFVTFGNHDSEETFTRTSLRAMVDAELKHQVAKAHHVIDDAGKEAYAIEIADDSGLRHVLYVFDSGANAAFDQESYDVVSLTQIAWYEQMQAHYQQASVDAAFMHIPLPEYNQAGEHITSGFFWDQNPRVAASKLNTGLFARLQHNGIQAVFCGHDHDNNFSGDWLGVACHYGNVSGYNCYGDLPRGYRTITLTADGIDSTVKQYPR